MTDLRKVSREAGMARGVNEYIERRQKYEKATQEATKMMELSMQESRIGAFTRGIRDTITEIVVGEDGKRKVQFKPEYLTVSSRGPEQGAPDFLKMSTLIFKKALDAGLYPEEYKTFVEAYGETYRIPGELQKTMLEKQYLDALVQRYISLTKREFGNVIDGQQYQDSVQGSLTDANRGFMQSMTELGMSDVDKVSAQIHSILTGTAPPSMAPSSRGKTDIIARLAIAASDPKNPNQKLAQDAYERLIEAERSGSMTGGLRDRWGSKPTAAERDKARDNQSLFNAAERILGRAKPEQLQTGHQLGLGLTKFSERIKDLKLGTIPVGEAMSKVSKWLAETQGVPKEEALAMERDFQLLKSDAKILSITFRRAWTGVAFRREEMKDYEKALPTLEKDDFTTFIAKVEHLRGFIWDSQVRLVSMILDGRLGNTTEEIRRNIENKTIPQSLFFEDKYYVTPYDMRVEGSRPFVGTAVENIKREFVKSGMTPEEWLNRYDLMPYIDPEGGPQGGDLGELFRAMQDELGYTNEELGFE